MSNTIPQLASVLQSLFTADADRLAKETGFVKRVRKIGGGDFARALVFGWLDRPDATVEELAEGLPVTPAALDFRITDTACDFLRALLSLAVGYAVAGSPLAAPLLRSFRGVYIEDMTDLGRHAGKALVRYELTSGRVESLEVLPAKASEVPSSRRLEPLPAGSLRLADRAFFDGGELRGMSDRGAHFITRVPTATLVWFGGCGQFEPITDWLHRQTADCLDVPALASEADPVAGRLLARRCPKAVAAKRLRSLEKTARRKQRVVSRRQRIMCKWEVFLTDLPADTYGPAEIEVLGRCRWQVELLFKRFKSLGGVGDSRGLRPARRMAEVLAKLLGALISEWAAMLDGGPLARTSPTARVRRVRRAARRVVAALFDIVRLTEVLSDLVEGFARLRDRRNRRSPSARQLVFRPRLMG